MNTDPEWVRRVRNTQRFHLEKVRADKHWGYRDTAKALKRSLGSITEDILVAKWLNSHGDKLVKFKYFHDAVNWVRDKKHKLMLEGN